MVLAAVRGMCPACKAAEQMRDADQSNPYLTGITGNCTAGAPDAPAGTARREHNVLNRHRRAARRKARELRRKFAAVRQVVADTDAMLARRSPQRSKGS